MSNPQVFTMFVRHRVLWEVFFRHRRLLNNKVCCQMASAPHQVGQVGHNTVVAARLLQILRDPCFCHLRCAAPRKYANRFVAHFLHDFSEASALAEVGGTLVMVVHRGSVDRSSGCTFETEGTPPSRRALWQGRVPCAPPCLGQLS